MPVLTGIDRRLVQRLPAFSPVAVRLMGVLAQDPSSFKEVARLIALDPVLAGEVLRLANSGLYGRRFEVRSILSAIALLGTGKLSQIAVTAALWRGLPSRPAPFVREWWRHSIAAALVARHAGKEFDADFSYTGALLHGVGQLALFLDASLEYPNLLDRAHTSDQDLLELERERFGVDHATLSGLILESWGLPESLCDSGARHHDEHARRPVVVAVQTGCLGAEYAGFGRCGCHHRLASPLGAEVQELFESECLLTLVAAVNQIECSFA